MIRATGRLVWRLCRIIFGFLLLGVGIFLSLPGVPGPGIVVILLSFGILSRDFHWAARAQAYAHRKWHELRDRQTQRPPSKESEHG
jgi:hypothetical protein